MNKNFNKSPICNLSSKSSTNPEPEVNNTNWGEIDPIYLAVSLNSGQDFEFLGMSDYLGKIEIAYCDGQWHAFADKKRQYSHIDKDEVEKLFFPDSLDASCWQADQEMCERERAEELAEMEAERDAREHRVYDAHGYSYRYYYDDYYYDVLYHRY